MTRVAKVMRPSPLVRTSPMAPPLNTGRLHRGCVVVLAVRHNLPRLATDT